MLGILIVDKIRLIYSFFTINIFNNGSLNIVRFILNLLNNLKCSTISSDLPPLKIRGGKIEFLGNGENSFRLENSFNIDFSLSNFMYL